jgi:hypothetical protein
LYAAFAHKTVHAFLLCLKSSVQSEAEQYPQWSCVSITKKRSKEQLRGIINTSARAQTCLSPKMFSVAERQLNHIWGQAATA